MELFASFNGPSDERFFAAVAAAALVSVLAGFFARRMIAGFLAGGAGAALATFLILRGGEGDMVGFMTAMCTPVFGLIGGALAAIIRGAS